MALSRFVLTANATIQWPATWGEVINGGILSNAAAPTIGVSAAPASIEVAAAAPAGGQAGPIPSYTFLQGTVVWADSSAGSTGPQQLYQAIGSGNLRAWNDGQDAVGHACLSN